MTFFTEKISIFTPKISDDFFLVIDLVFQILRFFTVLKCRIRPFLHKKNHYFRKEFLYKTTFSSFHSRASDNTTSLNIGGDQCMGRPPTSNFGGTVPHTPMSPPLGGGTAHASVPQML